MRFFCVSCKGHQAQKDTKKQERGSCWREKESKEGAWGEVEMVRFIVARQLCYYSLVVKAHWLSCALLWDAQIWMFCVSLLDKVICTINHFLLTNLHSCTLLDYRWEEERATDGSKWSFLEHKGPVMAAPYEPLPSNVRFFYDGKINTQVLLILWHLVYVCKLLSGIGWFLRSPLIYVGKQMKLSPEAEEVATFFAKMLDHEYTTKDTFRKNFFKDWRKVGNVQGCILRVCKLPAY